MKLNTDEKAMLDGKRGRARQRAMELLVQYGEALNAESFVDTNNVHSLFGFLPYPSLVSSIDPDDFVSKFLLDADERISIDHVNVFNTTHIWAMDLERWQVMGASENLHEFMELLQKYSISKGISITATCTPYQVGNIPIKGEHCAWTESSAVPFCNAVMGARTNTETAHSAFAAALTGKIPLSGLHVDENRWGTHQIIVETDLNSVMDWSLLGYYAGGVCQLSIPIFETHHGRVPNISMLKGLNAAGASSGGIMMYHLVGVTPEAATIEVALGGRKPAEVLTYGPAERRQTYEKLNSAKDVNVDLVNIGCPHYSLEQLRDVARLLDGKKVHSDVALWIWTAYQLKAIADRNGYTDAITRAGGHLLTDGCPLNTQGLFPSGVNTVATDAAKQAHYTPAITGAQVWFGTMEECIDAAVSGKWGGGLDARP